MSDAPDKRREPRRAADGEAALEQRPPASIRDLSAHGARLSLWRPEVPMCGACYQADLVFESEPPLRVEVKARIAWAEHTGGQWDVGIEFVRMDGRTESDVRRMLDLLDPPAHRGEPVSGVRMRLRPDHEAQAE